MNEVAFARDLLDGYDEVLHKVGPKVEGSLRKEADDLGSALEKRLRDLAEGYERLNQLALEAPLGLASAAAAHQARLSNFGMSETQAPALEFWDKEKHRDALWEAREIKRGLDARWKEPRRLSRHKPLRAHVPGAKFSSSRPPIFARRDAQPAASNKGSGDEYPVALRRYRGGYHGEPKEQPGPPTEAPTPAPPPKPRAVNKKPRAPKKTQQPVKIVVRERAPDLAAATKDSMRAAVAAARRAAAAAEKAAAAASRVVPVAPPRRLDDDDDEDDHPTTTVVVDEPAAEYRVLAPRRALAFERLAPRPAPQPIPVPQKEETQPRVRRVDKDVYLAAPVDADDPPAVVQRARRPAPCVEPGVGPMEVEQMLAVAAAEPVWIPEGTRKPTAPKILGATRMPSPPPPRRETAPPPLNDNNLCCEEEEYAGPSGAGGSLRGEGAAGVRLVARMMLDRTPPVGVVPVAPPPTTTVPAAAATQSKEEEGPSNFFQNTQH